MKRIFIQSDRLDEMEAETCEWSVEALIEQQGLPIPEKIFDEIISEAWFEQQKAWEGIKSADEIYATTSLIALSGFNSYNGAPALFDVLMQKAIEEHITGKKLFFINDFNKIYWNHIDKKLLKQCFKKNQLFTVEFDAKKSNYFAIPVNLKLI